MEGDDFIVREEPLLWIDIETTGLDPAAPEARILAVGLLVTDHNLVIKESIELLVGPPPIPSEVELWPEAVQDMHKNSGLIEALWATHSRGQLFDTDETAWRLATWVHDRFPEGKVMPAGASLQFDRKWLEVYMPSVARQLHYRQADVSALREFCQRWLPGCSDEDIKAAGAGKRDVHMPIPDIIDSIKLAAFLRGRMERGYGGTDLVGFDLDSPS